MNTSPPVVFDTRVVTGSGGGPDKTVLNSPRFLAPLGYTMLCGYLHPPGDPGYADIELKAARYNAPLVSIPDRGPTDVSVVSALLKVCREHKVAIWHGHDYKTNALGLALRPFHKMKLVTTVHGWVHHTSRTPLYYKIDRFCLKRYERVYCVSPDLVDACRAAGVKERKLLLLENGIDTAEYTRRCGVSEAKAELHLPADQLHVGAVGRLEPEKAFDLLIRAVHQLNAAGVGCRLTVVGEGHDRPRLEALVAELGMADRVSLPGWRSDVRRWFEAMDVFALSSRREGLPNVLLEAMALGVPCVATNIAGIPRLIADGDSGRLVPPDDLPALVAALTEVLTNEATREKYRTAGRSTIETRYSFAARMRTLAAEYNRLLARSVPAGSISP
jgi:glycosyltransferase involved in cell wall biosynthesis